MYKELVIELTGGRPDGTHTRFFFDRAMTARMRVIHATPDASWENIHVTGRAEDIAELHALLRERVEPPMQEIEIVSVTPRALQYVVKWRRASTDAAGTPLDFLLHEVVGPDAMYGMCIQAGRILVTVAGGDGTKLLAYFTRVRQELASRFDVRLVRVGDLSETVEGNGAAATPQIRAEDRDLVELALASGYYDSPKRCGVRELGDALGCSKSVVARKLRTIERQALETMLRPRPPDAASPAPGLGVYPAEVSPQAPS